MDTHIYDVYFGTYTRNSSSDGIYHAKLELKTGKLSIPELAGKVFNPSFIVIHPNGKYLYSVSEENIGKVSAFAIDKKTKKLKLLNQSSSEGQYPCYISIAQNGKTLLVANYGSGTLSSIPINNDGSLEVPASIIQHKGFGTNKERQQGPHVHSINLSPDNRFVYVADLGIDKIMIYRLNPENSKLIDNNPSSFALNPGSGPRHFTFHPNEKIAYLINELDNTLITLGYNSQSGALNKIQTISTLPIDFKEESTTAELMVHPKGKFLYASNRGHNSIAIYVIAPNTGKLAMVGFQQKGINIPRHFNIDPSGQFCLVANQDSNNVILFAIDQINGTLKSLNQIMSIDKPVCIKFLDAFFSVKK